MEAVEANKETTKSRFDYGVLYSPTKKKDWAPKSTPKKRPLRSSDLLFWETLRQNVTTFCVTVLSWNCQVTIFFLSKIIVKSTSAAQHFVLRQLSLSFFSEKVFPHSFDRENCQIESNRCVCLLLTYYISQSGK